MRNQTRLQIEFPKILNLGFLDLDLDLHIIFFMHLLSFLFFFLICDIFVRFGQACIRDVLFFYLKKFAMKMDDPSLKVSHFELLNERRRQDNFGSSDW